MVGVGYWVIGIVWFLLEIVLLILVFCFLEIFMRKVVM